MKKFFLLLVAVFILVAALWAWTNKDKILNSNAEQVQFAELKTTEEQEKNSSDNSVNTEQEAADKNSDLKNTQEENKNIIAEQNSETEQAPADFFAEENAIPVCNGNDKNPDNNEDHEIHEYKGFTLCYRESYEDAEWVAYILTKEELNAVTGRTNDFRPDPSITTGSSDLSDYKKSGYDRGHLAPAADMEWSSESCHESFFMSNMTPQAPQLNRGMWQQLESQVRQWADKFGKVIVVTGPVLEKNAEEYSSIGQNKVAVPEYFFKSILTQTADGSTIAVSFILPNSKCEGTIWDYCVSTDEVEQRCGFDVFSFLPDKTEEKIESTTDINLWQ